MGIGFQSGIKSAFLFQYDFQLSASAFGVRRDKAALFPVGENPTRLSLQPKATGAIIEATK